MHREINPRRFGFVINLQYSLNGFQLRLSHFQNEFIGPWRLTMHTIFAIGDKYNKPIFLIIFDNFFSNPAIRKQMSNQIKQMAAIKTLGSLCSLLLSKRIITAKIIGIWTLQSLVSAKISKESER